MERLDYKYIIAGLAGTACLGLAAYGYLVPDAIVPALNDPVVIQFLGVAGLILSWFETRYLIRTASRRRQGRED